MDNSNSPYIGRREGIGLGIETVPGTPVDAQVFVRWLDNNFQNTKTEIENESAMGVIDRRNDSEVVSRAAEGTIGGKLTSRSIGYLLLGMFGEVTTGAAVGGIYPHTFAHRQSAIPRTLTVTVAGPIRSQRHAYAVIDNLEITAETGGWVQFSAALKARRGVDTTPTIAFTSEQEFTSKHLTAYIADDLAGLDGAPALGASRVSVIMERTSEAFQRLGTSDEPEYMRGVFNARGEFVLRLTDTEYEDAFMDHARKALRIKMENDGESLTFTASKVRFTELEKTKDRDNVVTITVQYFAEFDTATNSSLVPILRNSQATYAAA